MRKGADCLSKWVGEAERQLRLLFDQAKAHQPSIIFFDEIDGLTPVRSSKQDQIHSSIVSTLLALMDGLDKRGQVIVIGATNRVDAIDPALRRPGRFDREMFFALPDRAGRREILNIHLRNWQPPVPPALLDTLSELTAGYAGADLKSLCTEAALCALHRVYPQIYRSERKLKLDRSRIQVEGEDFLQAMQKITPSSHRAGPQHADPMPAYLLNLFQAIRDHALTTIHSIFPFFTTEYGHQNLLQRRAVTDIDPPALCFRPRLLLTAESEAALDIVAKSVLYTLDGCYQLQLDLLSLMRDGSMTEALCSAVREAFHHAPAVLFLPRIDLCLQHPGMEEMVALLSMAMTSIPPTAPVLLLTTCLQSTMQEVEIPNLSTLPLFAVSATTTRSLHVANPSRMAAEAFLLQLLSLLLHHHHHQTPSNRGEREEEGEEELEFEEEDIPKRMEEPAEVRAARREKEEHYLREERTFFREILYSLSRNPRYRCFVDRVNEEDVPDYYEIIKNPMWFDKMFDKVDKKEYLTLDMFMKDIYLIVDNAKEYNPVVSGKRILRAGNSLLDEVESTVRRFKRKLHYDVFAKCDAIVARRKKEAEEDAVMAADRRKETFAQRKEERARKQKEKKEKREAAIRKRKETMASRRQERNGVQNDLVQTMETDHSFLSHEGCEEEKHQEQEKEVMVVESEKEVKEVKEEVNGEGGGRMMNSTENTMEVEEASKASKASPEVDEQLMEAGRRVLLDLLARMNEEGGEGDEISFDSLLSLYTRIRCVIGTMDAEGLTPEQKIEVRLID